MPQDIFAYFHGGPADGSYLTVPDHPRVTIPIKRPVTGMSPRSPVLRHGFDAVDYERRYVAIEDPDRSTWWWWVEYHALLEKVVADDGTSVEIARPRRH